MRAIITALGLLFGLAANAAIVTPPAPPFAPQYQTQPAQNNIMAWLPWQPSAATFGTTYNAIGTGRVSMQTMELEGDPLAVQVLFSNVTATAWALQQSVLSSTAMHGPGTFGGTTPYDTAGNAMTVMYPVTFNNGGQNSLPWSNTLANFTGNNNTSGQLVGALSLQSATAAGSPTLTTGATTYAGVFSGSIGPTVGMYITDGKGCVPAGTTVSAVGGGTITMSANAIGAGCLTNQTIWFSYKPINALGINLLPTTNGTGGNLIYSDWMPVPSLPRVDGGFVAGMQVSCTNCPASSTVQSLDYQSVTLSAPVTGTVAASTAVSFFMTPTTVGTALSGQGWVRVNSTTGLQVGQAVTGSASLPASAIVTEIRPGGLVRFQALLTGSIAPGTTLTFTNLAYTSAATTSGNTLSFWSTNNKRLYTFRSMAASGAPTGAAVGSNNGGGIGAWEPSIGLNRSQMLQSTTAVDGINVVTNVNNTTNNAGPASQGLIYGLRYITRQRGTTICTYGDSHMAGGGTWSGSNTYTRLAGAALSTPTRPVSVANTAIGATAPNIFTQNLLEFVFNGTCSIIMAEVDSGNSPNQQDQNLYLGQMTNLANAAGARVLFVLDTVRGANPALNWTVASDVTASTTVPITTRISGGFKNSGGSGYAITGIGIPGGTTFSYTQGATSITLSQAATIPAGTVLSLGANVAATTAGTTTVTLTNPLPVSGTSFDVTGTNIPANTKISWTQDVAAATLSQAATGSGATTLTLGFTPLPTVGAQQAGAGNWSSLATASQPVYDAEFCNMDPVNPPWALPTDTFDGQHINETGQLKVVNGNPNAPFDGCVSLKSVLARMIGN